MKIKLSTEEIATLLTSLRCYSDVFVRALEELDCFTKNHEVSKEIINKRRAMLISHIDRCDKLFVKLHGSKIKNHTQSLRRNCGKKKDKLKEEKDV